MNEGVLAPAERRLEQLLNWALSELEASHNNGWPAVLAGDTIGIWTSAQFIRAIALSQPSLSDRLTPAVEWLLAQQTDDYGWPLINGEQAATASTAEVIRALVTFLRSAGTCPFHQVLEDAIAQATKWLVHAQTRAGGWGFERSKSEVGSERVSITAYAAMALAEVADSHFAENVELACDFLLSARKEGGWADRNAGPATDHATILATEALLVCAPHKVRHSDAQVLLDSRTGMGIDGLPSYRITTEDVVRGTGVVTIYHDSSLPILRLANFMSIPFAAVPSLVHQYTQPATEPFQRLTCGVTGQIYPPIYWATAQTIQTLGVIKQLAGKQVIFDSAVRAACRVSGFEYHTSKLAAAELSGALLSPDEHDLLAPNGFGQRILWLDIFAQALAPFDPNLAGELDLERNRTVHVWSKRPGAFSSALTADPPVPVAQSILSACRLNELLSKLCTTDTNFDEVRNAIEEERGRRLQGIIPIECWGYVRIIADSLEQQRQSTTEGGVYQKSIILRTTATSFERAFQAAGLSAKALPAFADLQRCIAELAVAEGQYDVSISWIGKVTARAESELIARFKSAGVPITSVRLINLSSNHSNVGFSERAARPSEQASHDLQFVLSPPDIDRDSLTFEVEYSFANGHRTTVGIVHEFEIARDGSTVGAHDGPSWEPITFRFITGPSLTDDAQIVGRDGFANEIVHRLITTKQPLALNGPWRSGKSTFLNLVSARLREHDCLVAAFNLETAHLEFRLLCRQLAGLVAEEFGKLSPSQGGKQKWPGSKLLGEIGAFLSDIEKVEVGGVSVGRSGHDLALSKVDSLIKIMRDVDAALGSVNKVMVIVIDEFDNFAASDDPINFSRLLRGFIGLCNNIRFLSLLTISSVDSRRPKSHPISLTYLRLRSFHLSLEER